MAANLTSHEIIASALQLPLAERERIVEALQESLIDETIDHGPEEPADEVEAAWSEEIARRIADIDFGNRESASEPCTIFDPNIARNAESGDESGRFVTANTIWKRTTAKRSIEFTLRCASGRDRQRPATVSPVERDAFHWYDAT